MRLYHIWKLPIKTRVALEHLYYIKKINYPISSNSIEYWIKILQGNYMLSNDIKEELFILEFSND